MTKINVVGSLFGTSGYSVHTKGLALALKKLNPDTTYEGPVPQGWEKNATQDVVDLLSKPADLSAWQVTITHPLACQFKLVEPNKGVLPFMVFEGDIAPKQWGRISAHPNVKAVLCPSQHNYDALNKAGVADIHIVPHGHDPAIFNTIVPKDNPLSSAKCTFGWNKGWARGTKDRSGFDIVLKAFVEEFKDEPNVRLLAHINPAYNVPGWDLKREIDALQIPGMLDKKCEVAISTEVLPDKAVAQFYHACQFYCGVTKADAFNLPVLEAMACGVPPIISSFAGHMDFAFDASWGVVGGDEVPASISGPDDIAMYEQAKWQQPNEQALRAILRGAFNLWKNDQAGYAGLCMRASQSALDWTWEASARKLLDIIKRLEEST